MDILATLEADVNQWLDAIEERKQRAVYLRGECDRLVSDTIDLTEAKAKQARKDRAEYLTELELIDAQLSELHKRHEVAQQAVREYQVTQAQEVYERAAQEATEKRQALQAALDKRLHFLNHGGRKQTETTVNERKQIEIAVATSQAASTIATRKQAEAGQALQALRE